MNKPATRKRPPSYYLSRRYQRRMLVLVALLGVVLLTMKYVRRPEVWNWVFQGGPQEEARRIDNRLRPQPPKREIPGTFVARAEVPPSDGSDGLYPGVNPGYLRDVRDDSPYRAAEAKAFFHILHLLQQADQQQLEQASPEKVTFLQLYEQPSSYRGQLVSMRGYVRAAWPRQAPSLKFAPEHGLYGGLGTVTGMACTIANEFGVEGYTEVWLQPRERPDMVMMLYTLELPENFPTGDELKEDVTATGIFFKRIAYGAKGTYRTTPLLLTKSLRWEPPPPPPPDRVSELPLFLGIAAIMLGLSIVAVIYLFRQTKPTASDQPEYLQRILERNKDVKDTDFTGIDEWASDEPAAPTEPAGHDGSENAAEDRDDRPQPSPPADQGNRPHDASDG